jgi:vanillate O-demethylase monooxygenase subunit
MSEAQAPAADPSELPRGAPQRPRKFDAAWMDKPMVGGDMYVKDCWYMAGWATDFGDTITPLTLLGERVIVYRTTANALVAMEDRCCHRLAPLSAGRREGDDIRCLYHGLRFTPDGRCNDIPGQHIIPPTARVRTYPIAEKHSAAWIWMGAPNRADEGLIPNFVGVDDSNWCMRPGRMDYAANYMLVNDNLLDLSHIAYVHRGTFSRNDPNPESLWADSPPRVIPIDRGVRVQRWLKNRPAGLAAQHATEMADQWQSYDFLIPGVFLLESGFYLPGAADRASGGRPKEEAVHIGFTCQAVTPITDRTTCYFFGFGPWTRQPELREPFYQLGLAAFAEDRAMIEAQQRVIDATPNPRMMPMNMDQATSLFRTLMERQMKAESAAAG